jgi:REP element-mobilizing transposase RayT
MPDHAHLLVTAQDGKSPLDIGSCFKRLVTIEARKRGHSGALWQRRVHDRGIRTDFNHDPAAVIRYVLGNPVRQGLVSSWERWPFSHLHPEIGLAP